MRGETRLTLLDLWEITTASRAVVNNKTAAVGLGASFLQLYATKTSALAKLSALPELPIIDFITYSSHLQINNAL